MKPARNIELKARLRDAAATRYIALQIATEYLGVQEQTDTYFVCSQGRMKLREIAGQTAYMVWYDRDDDLQSKDSNYLIQEIAPDRAQQLKAEMGIRAVVTKRREVFLYNNVRIHLDEVAHLGSFLEFEAVLGPKVRAPTGRRQIAELRKIFSIHEADLLPDSYLEMIVGRGQDVGVETPA